MTQLLSFVNAPIKGMPRFLGTNHYAASTSGKRKNFREAQFIRSGWLTGTDV
jgi:hypothetical protein